MISSLRLLTALFTTALLVTACKPGEEQPNRSGFAALTQHAESFRQAEPGHTLSFPRDHGAHPEYRIEWWYLTANLSDTEGHPYGAQWTLFRLASEPPAKDPLGSDRHIDQVYMAHMAITTPDDHVSFQRYARGAKDPALARAGVLANPFSAWLDDWALKSSGPNWLPLEVQARQDGHSLSLRLKSDRPLILQGDAGFSQKHPDGGGSYYYSQPFLKAEGELIVDGQRINVSGEAWLDREWGSQFLQTDQVGWDWFSLHLESGEKLVLFQLRQQTGLNPTTNFRYGNLIAADGRSERLDADQIRMSVEEESIVMGHRLPMRWRIHLPQAGRSFTISALHPNQWMNVDFPYWEGAITVGGDGPENRGRGYMELTGYPAANHPP